MSSNPIPRLSIHASQHPVVDSQLKSLKLITRRLQSVIKIHEAELLILQRLFYKNKNQHRSALFWRNMSEIRRYSQRIVSLKLLDNLQTLRLIFHGSAATIPTQQSSHSARGSWTYFPSKTYLMNLSAKLDVARKLMERVQYVICEILSWRSSLFNRCQKRVRGLICGSSYLASITGFLYPL